MKTILAVLLSSISLCAQSWTLGDYQYGWRLNVTCVDVAAGGVIDQSGEKVAFTFRAPQTGSISAVRFRTGAVTLADDLLVSLQDVSGTTGDPDGTDDQSVVVALSASDDNVWLTATFTTSRSVTAGDMVALVITINSYVDGNLIIAFAHSQATNFPNSLWAAFQTGGTWTKNATHGPLFALEYTTTGFVPVEGVLPVSSCAVATLGTGSSPNEVGKIFQVPRSYVVGGVKLGADFDADAEVNLYDSSSTVIAGPIVIDANQRNTTGLAAGLYLFPTPVTLSAATNYRIGVKATSASTFTLLYTDLPDSAILASWPLGSTAFYTSRTGAGAWTDLNTRVPHIGLVINSAPDSGSTSSSHTWSN